MFDPETVDDLDTARAAFRWSLSQLHELRAALDRRKQDVARLEKDNETLRKEGAAAEGAALERAETKLKTERDELRRRVQIDLTAELGRGYERDAAAERRRSEDA